MDTTPRYKNDNQTRQYGNQRTVTVAGARETVGSQECKKPKRVKDYTYHKEKMLLCKQAEKGVPLQAEQANWLEDTDEEINEQELEAHCGFMAKIQEHSKQPESISSTCVLEKVDNERAALANLIANLTLDTEENKKILKQLKKANASLTQELKECKSNLEESNTTRDSCVIALQCKQTEFEKYMTFNDRTVDYDKLERKLNETLGLLVQKEIDIKEGLKLKAYEILVVKEKHDELVKHSLLTKSHYGGLVKEKTKIMHNYHLDRGVPRCAFKVDIQKAYDTVDWEFLRVALIGKRGLRQGDPLSPYLFTLVMEVFTLMLHRRVRDSSNFTYHRYCSELELINLCFADDLFLFAHGDVNSASIIKEALDEFKDASGLYPSMPKSKAYFCNVINHTKLAILHVLPFEEDRLPVKYLGVPLVSSRLIFRDCKELIDKVQNRVNDWKNKSLSVAGRLQLIQSVLGSLNVFWASVFVLPSRVLLDIEQIMRGFLWCQGSMSRGKAKVAWEVVCLPKKEGGLGIRRLDHFNKALMVSHIWKLLSLKESLWVKWIHVYKLRNRNDWLVKYPILNSIPVLVLNDAKSDVLEWRKSDGSYTPFSVQRVWDTIRPRDIEVPWYDLVWFSSCIPRHAVNMWLIMKKRLKTQDTLSSWDVAAGLMNVCPLCETQPDSHEHLFFDCSFFFQIWSRIKQFAGLMGLGSSLDSIVSILMPIAKRKSFKSCIGKLTLAAAAYFMWQERNFWLFKHSKRSVQEVMDCIMSSVRLKLLSYHFKKSKDAVLFSRLWELHVSMLK
ncbi:reverse transcriptase domain-containing protein [Tanacetum coccineum]|uniref:Reverse transcriptase domain-containing protein n=1 Tax=Tanacetum coccineum TaxID=301880 RepID=A0ABQ4WS91_9ASTR